MSTLRKQKSFDQSYGYFIFDQQATPKNLESPQTNLIFSSNSQRKQIKIRQMNQANSVILVEEPVDKLKPRRINFDSSFMNIISKIKCDEILERIQDNIKLEKSNLEDNQLEQEQISHIVTTHDYQIIDDEDDQIVSPSYVPNNAPINYREYLIIDDDDNMICSSDKQETLDINGNHDEQKDEQSTDNIENNLKQKCTKKIRITLEKGVNIQNEFNLIYRMVETKIKNVFKLVACKMSKRSQKLSKSDIKMQKQLDNIDNEFVIQYVIPSEIDFLEPINIFHSGLRDKVLRHFYQ